MKAAISSWRTWTYSMSGSAFCKRHVQAADAVAGIAEDPLEAPFLKAFPDEFADIHGQGRNLRTDAACWLTRTNPQPLSRTEVPDAIQKFSARCRAEEDRGRQGGAETGRRHAAPVSADP